jgi:RNA polymerase sigma factor (TIGR02999 family)
MIFIMNDVTKILSRIQNGDPTGASELLPLVYEELRQLARHKLAHELPGQTLQATALVHEAYLRLVGHQESSNWDSRAHFFGAAAEAMRRILVDQARRKTSLKRGGDAKRVDLDADIVLQKHSGVSPEELIALDEALGEFEAIDPVRARVVKLHYYSGFTLQETAEALGVSMATVKRQWVFARSWLFGKMRDR